MRIKGALSDVKGLCAALGLEKGSKPNQGGRMIRCPVHQERDASCGVTVGQDRCIRVHCFSCAFTGDVFSLIAAVYQLKTREDFPEILAIAADLAGVELPPRPGGDGAGEGGGGAPARRPLPPLPPSNEPPPPPPPPPATLKEELAIGRAVDALSAAFPVGADAGISTGLHDRQLFEAATKERWIALPKTNLLALFEKPEFLPIRPLVVKDEPGKRPFFLYQDHRLVIPWRKPDGGVWSFQRRFSPLSGTEDPKKAFAVMPGEKQRHIPKFVWPTSAAYVPRGKHPFGADAFAVLDAGTEESWWAEGAHDVLSLRILNQWGLLSKTQAPRAMSVVGIPGVSALRDFLPSLVPVARGKRGVVATDGDKAGADASAAWQSAQELVGARAVRIIRPPPPHLDWNLMLQAER